MDVFIYFPPNLGTARDEIEEALEDSLGEVAEVTGGGSGQAGSNVDLVFNDLVPADKALDILRRALKDLRIHSAKIVMNGREYLFDSQG
jgi:hypothetical protein